MINFFHLNQAPLLSVRKIVLTCNQSVADIIMKRDVFQGIADPTRRSILALLALHAMTPNAIAEHFDSSRQAVSKHIKVLAECGLVRQEQIGREIYYHFEPKKMKAVDQWLEPFRKNWSSRFNQLDAVLVQSKNKKP